MSFSTLGPLVLKTLNYQTQPHCRDPEQWRQLQHFLRVLNHQHHLLLKWIVTKKKYFFLCFNCFLFTSSGTGILGLFRISTAERSFFTKNDSCEGNVTTTKTNNNKRQENIKPWIIEFSSIEHDVVLVDKKQVFPLQQIWPARGLSTRHNSVRQNP